MPAAYKLGLTEEQIAELEFARRRHPKPYVRERAAAILKVSAGNSIRQVALKGLLRRRRPETVKEWINRYLAEGLAGLLIRPGRGRKPVFSPLKAEEAKEQVEQVLERPPRWYGIPRSRWRLQDVGRVLDWLKGVSDPGIYKVLKRLGFSRKQALHFIRSPDPEYRAKWQRILLAYREAFERPGEVVLLFLDELTYYRQPTLARAWSRRGKGQPRAWQRAGPNTKTRLVAVLNAVTGQVTYLQRSKVGTEALVTFYAQVRAAYPEAEVIYVAQDNWPVHKLEEVLAAAQENRLTPLFLPTYASWLNPIEKLWRWLKQEVIHLHRHADDLAQLRREVCAFLDQFAQGSPQLLNYVGILSKEELASVSGLNC